MSRNDPQGRRPNDRKPGERMPGEEMPDELSAEKRAGTQTGMKDEEEEIRGQRPSGAKPTGMKDKKGNQPR